MKGLGLCSQKQYFLNFNVHTDYLGILWKWRFWFSKSGVCPESLHFWWASKWCWCCWYSTFWVMLKRSYTRHLLKMARKTLFKTSAIGERDWRQLWIQQGQPGIYSLQVGWGEIEKLLRGIWLGVKGGRMRSVIVYQWGFLLKSLGFLLNNRIVKLWTFSSLHQGQALLMCYEHWDRIQYFNIIPKKRACACNDLPIQQQGSQSKIISSHGCSIVVVLEATKDRNSSFLTLLITHPIIFLFILFQWTNSTWKLSSDSPGNPCKLSWEERYLTIGKIWAQDQIWGSFSPWIRGWEGFNRESRVNESQLLRIWGHLSSLLSHSFPFQATCSSSKGLFDSFLSCIAQHLFLSLI